MADVKKEIRAGLKEGKIVLGSDETMKLLRAGKIKRVYLAANASASMKNDASHYGKLANAEVVQLELSNVDLGVLCKKPFSISVLGAKAE